MVQFLRDTILKITEAIFPHRKVASWYILFFISMSYLQEGSLQRQVAFSLNGHNFATVCPIY